MKARNDAICAYYQAGNRLANTASKFKLGRQRILQILQHRGVWKPYERTKGNRTEFLGVTVTPETKDGLTKLADEKGISVSKLTSDVLDETVKG